MDGTVCVGWPEQWVEWPGEGVDRVAILTDGYPTELNAQSVYWLYQERETWVLGGGPVGYGRLPPEVVVGADGLSRTRPIAYMPDLPHRTVKLGHWWPGTTEPVWQ